ncbi:MAG: hypothetical protein MZU95_07645 [Desulfomicrobium escambiense]|nr:hypothetical protein [Desulfomicrobium escambiense]
MTDPLPRMESFSRAGRFFSAPAYRSVPISCFFGLADTAAAVHSRREGFDLYLKFQ